MGLKNSTSRYNLASIISQFQAEDEKISVNNDTKDHIGNAPAEKTSHPDDIDKDKLNKDDIYNKDIYEATMKINKKIKLLERHLMELKKFRSDLTKEFKEAQSNSTHKTLTEMAIGIVTPKPVNNPFPSKKVINEGTRSLIGIQSKDGAVESIYCHWDGYLDHNGKILKSNYKNVNKIKKLIALGDISLLAKDIGKKHDFENPNKGWVVAYGRDRGESGVSADTHRTVDSYENAASDSHAEYIYLYKEEEKKWYYATPSGRPGWKEL